MRASLERIADGYAKAGAKDRFTGRFYEEPHQFTRPMQDAAIDWFDRQLRK